MTYFHRRPSTIIGAKAFHCPVRDGKEWYHLAMVVKRNCLSGCLKLQPLESWRTSWVLLSLVGSCPGTAVDPALRMWQPTMPLSIRRGSYSTKTKPHRITCGVLRNKSLTMTYFHRRPSTIIGAKAFHCPVRDGKEWYHLAMVVRRNWLSGCGLGNCSNLGRNTTCGDQRLAR